MTAAGYKDIVVESIVITSGANVYVNANVLAVYCLMFYVFEAW